MSRFKTVGRDMHNLGRISLRLSVDVVNHALSVFVNSARDLPDRIQHCASFVRVQVHKKKQSDKVVSELFSSSTSEPKRTATSWRSSYHQSTLFPMFQEVEDLCPSVRIKRHREEVHWWFQSCRFMTRLNGLETIIYILMLIYTQRYIYLHTPYPYAIF